MFLLVEHADQDKTREFIDRLDHIGRSLGSPWDGSTLASATLAESRIATLVAHGARGSRGEGESVGTVSLAAAGDFIANMLRLQAEQAATAPVEAVDGDVDYSGVVSNG